MIKERFGVGVSVGRHKEKLSNTYGRRLIDSCLGGNKLTESWELLGSLLILQRSSSSNNILTAWIIH